MVLFTNEGTREGDLEQITREVPVGYLSAYEMHMCINMQLGI